MTRKEMHRRLLCAASLAVLLCCGLHMLRGHGFTSLMAVGELRSGEAEAYYETALSRRSLLDNPAVKDAELEPFPVTPYLLYVGDIEENMDSYINQDMSSYYEKNSVLPRQGS